MQPYITFQVSAYSFWAIVGLFFMMITIYMRNKLFSYHEFLILIGLCALGAVGGSKLLFIITCIPDIVSHYSIRYAVDVIVTSGFVFYGGLFGAICGCSLFAKWKKVKVRSVLNMTAPGFAIFHAFGRIGCLFSGCCYGKEATWGIALESSPDIPRIPVQLIESGCIVMIFAVILLVEWRLRANRMSFSLYIGLYAVCRFIIEFFRDDLIRGMWGPLSTSQWISLGILFYLCLGGVHKSLGKCSFR